MAVFMSAGLTLEAASFTVSSCPAKPPSSEERPVEKRIRITPEQAKAVAWLAQLAFPAESMQARLVA